jgi:hypothetical protein
MLPIRVRVCGIVRNPLLSRTLRAHGRSERTRQPGVAASGEMTQTSLALLSGVLAAAAVPTLGFVGVPGPHGLQRGRPGLHHLATLPGAFQRVGTSDGFLQDSRASWAGQPKRRSRPAVLQLRGDGGEGKKGGRQSSGLGYLDGLSDDPLAFSDEGESYMSQDGTLVAEVIDGEPILERLDGERVVKLSTSGSAPPASLPRRCARSKPRQHCARCATVFPERHSIVARAANPALQPAGQRPPHA